MDAAPGPAGSQPHVLLVAGDAELLGFLVAVLQPSGYRLDTARSAEAALDAVREELPDLLLLEARLPDRDGCELVRSLQAEPWTRAVPALVLLPAADPAAARRALEAGAEDVLRQPLDADMLRARVRSLLRAGAERGVREQAEEALILMARAIDGRDPTNAEHSSRVARLAEALGQACGLDAADLHAVRLGGHLHDIGMVVVPERVLLKPGRLDPKESALLHSHPVAGEALLRPLAALDAVRALVRHHHERLDGSGYPDGLRGAEIPLPVRILSLADVFDVLTSRRPFHPPLSRAAALAVLRAEAGAGRWDADVLRALETCAPDHGAPAATDSLLGLSLHIPEGR